MKNPKGFTYKIDYRNHSSEFETAVKELKKQHIPLERDISTQELINFIDFYKSHDSIISGSAGAIAYILELKYLISIYLNDEDLSQRTLIQIIKEKEFWNMNHFESWIGNYDRWIERLQNISIREIQMSIDSILDNKKLDSLHIFELMPRDKTLNF